MTMTKTKTDATARRLVRLATCAAVVFAMTAFVAPAGFEPYYNAHAQRPSSDGFTNSPFERSYGDVKFLDAYFGTLDEKIEVEAGDSNVPFTVIFANVGTQDITGIRGQLSMPFGFSSPDGPGTLIYADSETNALAGDTFTLTFFVNVEDGTQIQQYAAAAKVDYSRFRESGTRTTFANFDFQVTGDTVVNVRAVDPFLTSLRVNEIAVVIANDGTAPLAGVEVVAANTQTERATTASSITNVENIVLSESSWDLGQIAPGSADAILTTVYVPETLRGETLRIPLEISYYNAHGDKITISKIVDFFVKGLIDLTVFNVDVIQISGSPMIIGEIINEGNEDGLFGFVHVTPLGDSNLKPVSQFIDEIETDAPVPFNIPVEFEGTPRYGEHGIQIDIRYKDSIREEHILTHNEQVVIPAPPPAESGPFDLIGNSNSDSSDGSQQSGNGGGGIANILVAAVIGVVVAVFIAIWWAASKRRKANKKYDYNDENDSPLAGTAG